MFSQSTWKHLRIPFSIFLMPVFCFALSLSPNAEWWSIAIAFLSIHIFLYPASNGYNSYYDKDEGSIGGLETPPPVKKELYWAALLFDAIAIVLALLLSWHFALALFIYGLISKAYSHDRIRLKKFPIISWLTVGIFQGAFMLLASYQAINHLSNYAFLTDRQFVYAAILSSCMLLGSYPMTQIYQHEEDAKRGDKTLSRLLGIKGTFLFTGIVFGLTSGGFFAYYLYYYSFIHAVCFLVVLSPVLIYFSSWFLRVHQNIKAADFRSTMRLNIISSLCLALFYVGVWLVEKFL
ncbi:MAG: UbiA family prenyltransferase [Flammeovirgaceae bacterium]